MRHIEMYRLYITLFPYLVTSFDLQKVIYIFQLNCYIYIYIYIHKYIYVIFYKSLVIKNAMSSVRKRTIPTERPQLVSEVSANFLRIEGTLIMFIK
jgi:hypothetical protein